MKGYAPAYQSCFTICMMSHPVILRGASLWDMARYYRHVWVGMQAGVVDNSKWPLARWCWPLGPCALDSHKYSLCFPTSLAWFQIESVQGSASLAVDHLFGLVLPKPSRPTAVVPMVSFSLIAHWRRGLLMVCSNISTVVMVISQYNNMSCHITLGRSPCWNNQSMNFS